MTLNEFLADKTYTNGYQFAQVRGKAKAIAAKRKELRTKKNTFQATVWDELGNLVVLTRSGMVMQLIGSAELKKAGMEY
mgnify:FL=1|tara:strand:- start:475 stop:711 length:237 start_codon:yes stop_codon:yes gene_type:complete